MNVAKKLLRAANAAGGGGNQSLFQIINGLGLTTNLKLCLDAGDSASYDPSVQTDKWLDTSGNGCDFFLGDGTGSDEADPTFNGDAGGLSSGEYFAVGKNGTTNRKFSYDSATPETWMYNLSQNNAAYTLMCVWKPQLTLDWQPLFDFGYGTAVTSRGLALIQNSLEGIELRIYDASSNQTLVTIAAGNQTINGWNVLFVSVNESESSGIWRNNTKTGTFTANYSKTANFTGLAKIFSNLPAGTLGACAAVWEGAALSAANLTAIYNAIKGRFDL